MKKLAILIFLTLSINAHATSIKPEQLAQAFQNYDACFILYNLNKQTILINYNPHNRCHQRVSPNSTFKIPLSLMAFNEGLITQDTLFKWDHQKREPPEWNQNQTPSTWLKYSVVWVSQRLTAQLGLVRIEDYLDAFNYGNQDFSGDPDQNNGLNHAWLSSSLKISATEQLEFLKTMLNGQLPVKSKAVTATKDNMYLGKLESGDDYYGKTGSGRHGNNERQVNPSRLRDGWFVGFVERNNETYIFVANLTDKQPVPIDKHADAANPLKPYGSQILKPIVLNILNEYFTITK